ncbi:hydrogenase expression/formation protein [Thiohalorhabdus methylotrophus]|uniref:Hydrogenase expression/formation protein n=1 Tax=Thiohalorhabdus methylotrophus TaxID=3242694 RepID=A0ABV4TWV2_9GAMM
MRLEDISIVPNGGGDSGEDPEPEYTVMPDDMATYMPPDLTDWEGAVHTFPEAVARLQRIQAEADFHTVGSASAGIELEDLDDRSRQLVNDVLGEGEVSIRIDGGETWQIQEAVMAGIWRLRRLDPDGTVAADRVEVGAIPEVVTRAMLLETAAGVHEEPAEPEAVNARALRVELAHHVAAFEPEQEAHVINLTLLPMTEADQADLERIGRGPVTMLSRGYGNCRITATAVRNLWRVQYFNSTDQLILDTLEVVRVPKVAQAAQEDIDESAVRLREMLEQLQ